MTRFLIACQQSGEIFFCDDDTTENLIAVRLSRATVSTSEPASVAPFPSWQRFLFFPQVIAPVAMAYRSTASNAMPTSGPLGRLLPVEFAGSLPRCASLPLGYAKARVASLSRWRIL